MNSNEINGQIQFNHGSIVQFPSNVDIAKKHHEDLRTLQKDVREGKEKNIYKRFLELLTSSKKVNYAK